MSAVLHPLPSLWDRAAHELSRRALRGVKRLVRPMWMRRLAERNEQSRESILSADGPVVSLTTYEPRWPQVHWTIESIGAGQLKPSRLILWVAPSVLELGTPAPLQRLVARGLEIRTCEDLGPHKKYYPAVMEASAARGLVTADDDVIYWNDWLAQLAAAATRRPGFIHAHRAHVMSFEGDGRFRPYAQWPACRSTAPSALHFTTGVGGVWYPPAMQDALRTAGDAFRASCPRADDIWLNAVAWRSGTKVCQTSVFSRLLFEVPGTRAHGLAKHNVDSGGNDRQLEATYTPQERLALQSIAVEEYGRDR
ncbi:hypothetical protein [Caldimonas sp. KR1-144]|uniref:hypothetical protein n=1 Tax=Caldimonas sp. KR1-144 TaxID=3400911 RepID=UPI003C00064D